MKISTSMGLSNHLSNHPWSFSLYIKISTLEDYRIRLEVGGSRRIVGVSSSPLFQKLDKSDAPYYITDLLELMTCGAPSPSIQTSLLQLPHAPLHFLAPILEYLTW